MIHEHFQPITESVTIGNSDKSLGQSSLRFWIISVVHCVVSTVPTQLASLPTSKYLFSRVSKHQREGEGILKV